MKSLRYTTILFCFTALCLSAEAKMPDIDGSVKKGMQNSLNMAAEKQSKANLDGYGTALNGSAGVVSSYDVSFYAAVQAETLRNRAGEIGMDSRVLGEKSLLPVPVSKEKPIVKTEEEQKADYDAMMARIRALQLEWQNTELAALRKNK